MKHLDFDLLLVRDQGVGSNPLSPTNLDYWPTQKSNHTLSVDAPETYSIGIAVQRTRFIFVQQARHGTRARFYSAIARLRSAAQFSLSIIKGACRFRRSDFFTHRRRRLRYEPDP
jgi:hypothetical protein